MFALQFNLVSVLILYEGIDSGLWLLSCLKGNQKQYGRSRESKEEKKNTCGIQRKRGGHNLCFLFFSYMSFSFSFSFCVSISASPFSSLPLSFFSSLCVCLSLYLFLFSSLCIILFYHLSASFSSLPPSLSQGLCKGGGGKARP